MKRNLTESLVDDLRTQIIGGSIVPGDRLPSENTLMEAHGVSRTVVREAITRLQAEGLVHTRKGSGSFALTPPSEPSSASIRSVKTLSDRQHLLDFRTGVESEAASMAARHIGPEQLDELSGALERFDAAGNNPSARLNCDFEFHLAIARASQNPYILDTVSNLGPSMISMPPRRLETHDAASSDDRLQIVSQEHRSIFAAIIANDPMAAAAAMRSHLANSKTRLAFEAGCRPV